MAFRPNVLLPQEEVISSFQFAQGMINNHRRNFQGGPDRDNREIFINDFQGKLAEFAVRRYINDHIPTAHMQGDIDLRIMPLGYWDNHDLIVNGNNISIKSVKHFSSLLLIETSRFNSDGGYSYQNNNGEDIIVDYYILVKVKISPDIRWDDLNQNYVQFLRNRVIEIQLCGGIHHIDFWRQKALIRQDETIGRGTPLKVDNYVLNENKLVGLVQLLGQ